MKRLFSALILAFCFLLPLAHSQQRKKEWDFVHVESGDVKNYKQGQIISVTWRGMSGTKVSKGTLIDITSDSLSLEIAHQIGTIANKDIEEIYAKKRFGLKNLFAATLILAGLIVLGIGLLFQVIYNSTRTDRQLAAGETKSYWLIGIFGLGFIIWGVASMKPPSHIRTVKPFEKEWILDETPVISNYQP